MLQKLNNQSKIVNENRKITDFSCPNEKLSE